ncbi:MAG: U32 family peptidase [Elusimicrobiota bacterium]
MIIQVGAGTLKEIEKFLKLGADEFYCGLSYIPSHVEKAPNFSKQKDFIEAKKLLGRKKLFYVANEVQGEIIWEAIKAIEELAEAGVDGFIIKDIAIFEELKKRKLKLFTILSTLSLCLNSYSLKFFKNYGIKRIALCEQITPEEAKNIIKQIETEMFIKHRETCKMFNGICFLNCHGEDSTACLKTYLNDGKIFRMTTYSTRERLRQFYRFYKLGVNIVKIGRSPLFNLTQLIFSEAKLISAIAEKAKTEDEFLSQALKAVNDYDKIYKKLSLKYRFIC